MKLNWTDVKYVLFAVVAGLSAMLAAGLLEPPASQWGSVLVTVLAALVGYDSRRSDPPTTP